MIAEEYDEPSILAIIEFKKLIQLLEAKGYIGDIYILGKNIIKGCILPFDLVFREATYHLNRLNPPEYFKSLSPSEFRKLLEDDGIVTNPNLDDYQKRKERYKDMAKPDAELLQQLAKALSISDRKLRYSNLEQRWTIQGRRGLLYTDHVYWYLAVKGNSKRHFSSIRKQLSFMELTTDTEDHGIFRCDKMPTEAEQPVIRKIVGVNKAPTLTEERVKQLQSNGSHFAQASI